MRWLRVSMGMALAVLSAVPAVSQVYALGTVRVLNGHPVSGVEDGVVFSQSFDSSCELVADGRSPDRLVLSGTVGSTLELDVAVLGCQTSAEPRVACTWKVLARGSEDASCREAKVAEKLGREEFTGWQGAISLPLPRSTGIYDLVMECDASAPGSPVSEPSQLRRALFVTYSRPLDWVSPPEIDWYRMASCWGGGFGPDASEGEVLEAILAGLYRYGEENWLYGYAYEPEEDTYSFPIAEKASRSVSRQYVFHDGAGLDCSGEPVTCRCYWQQLVSSESLCNFSDCFVFSRTFQAISAVAGIGGLIPETVEGTARLGFVTPSDAVSFDANFSANVLNLDRGATFPYYFGAHSLLHRDGLYYDATFDHVEDSASDSIGLSVSAKEGDFAKFFESQLVKRFVTQGYGAWPFYQLSLPPPESTDQATAAAEPGFRLTGQAQFRPAPPDAGGHSASLDAEVKVEVVEAGTYSFSVALWKDDELITDTSSSDLQRSVVKVVSGPPGEYTLALSFSGEHIYKSGKDGPYTLKVLGSGIDEAQATQVLRAEYESPPFSHEIFGEIPFRFGVGLPTVRAVTLRDGRPALEIEIPFIVHMQGVFAWEARISTGNETIAYVGYNETLAQDAPTLKLEVTADDIRKAVEAGGGTLTMIIYDEHLQAVDAWTGSIETLLPNGFPP